MMYYFLYFILISLTVYTDTPLTKYFGALGFSFIPLVCFLLYPMLLYKRIIWVPFFAKVLLRLINYALLLSVICFFVFIFMDIPSTLYGENIIIKAIKLYLTYLSYFLYIVIICSIGKNIPTNELYKPFFVLFIFLTFFAFVEYQNIPDAFLNFHHSSGSYYRVRLLTQESSHTAPLLEVFFLLSCYYTIIIRKSKWLFTLVLFCFIYQLYVSSSKSLAVIVLLSIVYAGYSIFKSAHGAKKMLVIGVFAFISVFAYLFIYVSVVNSFQGDIENSTSTATRSLTILSGYLSGILFPFGSGFFSYLYIFPMLLMELVSQIGGVFNLEEILDIISNNTDAGVVPQSFFSFTSTFWGVLGNFYFFVNLKKEYRCNLKISSNSEIIIIKSLFFCIVLNLCFTIGFEFYIQAFVCILIIRLKKNEINMANSRTAIPA